MKLRVDGPGPPVESRQAPNPLDGAVFAAEALRSTDHLHILELL